MQPLTAMRIPCLPVLLSAAVFISALLPSGAAAQETLLLRMPDVSEAHVAFVYANDIWIADRDGSGVRRLTTFEGAETNPHFSPDGSMVAFSGEYDGNTDVYIVPAGGGEPTRLTWHPYGDAVKGWTPDGGRVMFASGRDAAPISLPSFWTVSVDGGAPEELPIPRLNNGSYSPEGSRFAYEMVTPWETEFRNYRGGQNDPIRLIDLESLEVEKLPWDGTMDQRPVWMGDTVFFMSDRDYTMNVWAYDVPSGTLEQRTFFEEFDVKQLSGGGGALVFENGGTLYLMDAATGSSPQRLSITVRGDFPWARPHWEDVSGMIRSMDISPNGKRAVFESRGEIFTVPAEHGDIRNLSESSGAGDRIPAWSPDGTKVAWFSDASGEYALHVSDQYGRDGRTHQIDNPTYFQDLDWAPDSRHVAFRDVDQNLHVFDTVEGEGRIVDNAGYSVNSMSFDWSPDSRWLAYSKKGPNHYHGIHVYSMEDDESRAVTDGMSEANNPVFDESGKYLYFLSSVDYGVVRLGHSVRYGAGLVVLHGIDMEDDESRAVTDGMSEANNPVFDESGKYLYFLSSVDYGLNVGWLDMSSYNQPVNRSLHLVVLAADEANPLAPRSDDEDDSAGADSTAAADSLTTIDFDGLRHRILAVDMPERPYTALGAGTKGVIFVGENVPNKPGVTIHRYKLEERKSEEFLTGVSSFVLTDDGKKMGVSRAGGGYAIIDADGAPNQTEGALDVSDMQMYLDPAAEWRQMFEEGIRKQRDQLYVENVHGLDLNWFRRAYGPMVDHVRHRSDLTYLLDILGGETSIGHSFAGGGDTPDVASVSVGLLGADLAVDNGRYRISKIYRGDPWNPDVTAPLSGPGIDVSEGEYILAVNGRELTADDNFHSAFERTNGRETFLSVAASADAGPDDRRRVTVHPLGSEAGLRQYDWVESNRRRVDEMSDGRLAYVWLPNTGTGGYNNFNRYYFAQKHKKGAVIDERFNGGGSAADYIVDYLARELMGYFNNTADKSEPYTVPNAALFGPKVMLINERAGSGGDLLPYMFKKRQIGPLIGTTTWGGLVGWSSEPALIDGGYVASPGFGFYDTNGEWAVENEGVAPDIEVEESPRLAAEGRDAQLERAVEEALRLLETEAVELLPQPADPVRVRRAGQE